MQTTWPNMTCIFLTLEFLKFEIVKSKKQATKKPQSYYGKKHTTFTKKKTTLPFKFQYTVTNIMTKSKQFFTYHGSSQELLSRQRLF